MKQIALLLFLIPFSLFSQQIFFCEAVDRSGYPKNVSKEFTIGNDGGFIKILIKMNKAVGSNNIIFDVYKMENNKELFDNTVQMEIKPALTWFYKEITFFNGGSYRIYVYDERNKLLGLGEVKINLR